MGCPRCAFRAKRYGLRHGRQRYRCLTCKHIFQRQLHPLPVTFTDFIDFCRYATKTIDQEVLCSERQVTRQELSGRFRWFLTLPPSPELVFSIVPATGLKPDSLWVYGYDGKWLGRFPVLLIHRDVTHKETLWWSVVKHEGMVAMREDLIRLGRKLHYHPPSGAVCDGKPGMMRLITHIFHLETCQRCLVHVARDLKTYLPLQSPLEATQTLRRIALTLTQIESFSQQTSYFHQLERWQQTYGSLLKERSYPTPQSQAKRKWWYTHGNLRRAWRLMTKNPESLFHYLNNPLVPKTNNSLEGINRHLYRRPGMSKGKQLSLMMWKLALSRVKTPTQRRKLWDIWKTQLRR